MKLVNKKKFYFIITIVSLIFLTLNNVFISIFQSKINDYNHEIVLREHSLLNLQDLYQTFLFKKLDTELAKSTNGTPRSSSLNIMGDSEYVKIWKEYDEGNLENSEFWNKLIKYNSDKSEEYRIKHLDNAIKLNSFIDSPPKIFGFKIINCISFCINLQIIIIFLILLFHSLIYFYHEDKHGKE